MRAPRKRKKFFGNYILVKRRDGRIIIRRYPRDLAEWNRTKDPSKVHPNKLRTWINFAETAKKVRGMDYDSAMEVFITELTGKRVKKLSELRILPLGDVYGLVLQAIEKGVDPNAVTKMVVPEETVKMAGLLPKKQMPMQEVVSAIEKMKNPLRVRK